MTDRIEAALDALGKATPGPWCPHYIHDLLRIGRKSLDITTDCDCLYEPDENDAVLIAAAPDLAAEVIRLRKWQSEALSSVKVARMNTCDCDAEVCAEMRDYLDRLIAEAEGE